MHDAVLASRTQKWFRFLIGGVINTGFTYCIYLVMLQVIGYQWAYFLAYIIGVVFAYGFNAIIVFKVSLNWKAFFSYPLVYVVQYVVSAVTLGILVQGIGLDELLGPIIGAIMMMPVTYWLSAKVLVVVKHP